MITELDAEGLRVARHLPHTVLDGADDAQLVARARNGCAAAIEQLVGRYESRIFRLACNITGNHEDAEEVLQNAFFKALLNLAAFRGDSRFYTWLVRIAVNEALMKIRSRRFRDVSIDDAKGSEDREKQTISQGLRDWGPNPEQRYSQEELRGILETAISKLAPGYRTVFHLRDIEGFSLKETAQALHLSLATVKSRERRARLKLRDELDAYFQPKKAKRKSQTVVMGDVRSSGLRRLLPSFGGNDSGSKAMKIGGTDSRPTVKLNSYGQQT
jgi:RNA polymerase sigma-70 factor (ECF subfamily)